MRQSKDLASAPLTTGLPIAWPGLHVRWEVLLPIHLVAAAAHVPPDADAPAERPTWPGGGPARASGRRAAARVGPGSPDAVRLRRGAEPAACLPHARAFAFAFAFPKPRLAHATPCRQAAPRHTEAVGVPGCQGPAGGEMRGPQPGLDLAALLPGQVLHLMDEPSTSCGTEVRTATAPLRASVWLDVAVAPLRT